MDSLFRNRVNDLLSGFGSGVGLSGCALDSGGVAQFAFDGIFVSLVLDAAAGELRLLAPIGRPDAWSLGPLMDSNLAGGGMLVAREAGSGLVLLMRILALDGLDLPRFEAALSALVDRAESLRATLAVTAEPDLRQGVEIQPWMTGVIRG